MLFFKDGCINLGENLSMECPLFFENQTYPPVQTSAGDFSVISSLHQFWPVVVLGCLTAAATLIYFCYRLVFRLSRDSDTHYVPLARGPGTI